MKWNSFLRLVAGDSEQFWSTLSRVAWQRKVGTRNRGPLCLDPSTAKILVRGDDRTLEPEKKVVRTERNILVQIPAACRHGT